MLSEIGTSIEESFSVASLRSVDTDDPFVDDVLKGLFAKRKTLSCKWLYDDAGSDLFEAICALPEYYPYKAEMALIGQSLARLAELFPREVALIELGSGASRKTRLLLDGLPGIVRYVPIDICRQALCTAASSISRDYRTVVVEQRCRDFGNPCLLDLESIRERKLLFFPGSTIGNMEPERVVGFLAALGHAAGDGAHLLIGTDVRKDVPTMIRAYDDSQGVTAAFNKNLLRRVSRLPETTLCPDDFSHRARWNARASRIEMHLEAQADLEFSVAGKSFAMKRGHSIHTENCYKLTPGEQDELFTKSGWSILESWTGTSPSFRLTLLEYPGRFPVGI